LTDTGISGKTTNDFRTFRSIIEMDIPLSFLTRSGRIDMTGGIDERKALTKQSTP
jgi:hypothetical protein